MMLPKIAFYKFCGNSPLEQVLVHFGLPFLAVQIPQEPGGAVNLIYLSKGKKFPGDRLCCRHCPYNIKKKKKLKTHETNFRSFIFFYINEMVLLFKINV